MQRRPRGVVQRVELFQALKQGARKRHGEVGGQALFYRDQCP